MTGMQARVVEFHRAVGPSLSLDAERVARLRISLLTEECGETIAAIACDDREQIADGLADVLYVVFGTAIMYDIDLEVAPARDLKDMYFRPPNFSSALDAAIAAIAGGDREKIADGLATLLSIAFETAIMYNIDLEAAFATVHESNMSKIGPEGPVVRPDGKILKGPHFRPPDFSLALKQV